MAGGVGGVRGEGGSPELGSEVRGEVGRGPAVSPLSDIARRRPTTRPRDAPAYTWKQTEIATVGHWS